MVSAQSTTDSAAQCLVAEVMRSNARAIMFYEKFGFAVSDDESLHSESSVVLTKIVNEALVEI